MNTDMQSDKKQATRSGLFLKRFKTSENHYIYDVNSNGILKVSEVIWDVVDMFSELIEDIMIAYDTIRKAKESSSLGCLWPAIRTNDIQQYTVRGMFENFGIQQLILKSKATSRFILRYNLGFYKLEA